MTNKAPKRVVIYRLGSLGDTIVALPCFHKIMEYFPDSERVLLTNIPVSAKAVSVDSLLVPGGFIQRSISYRLGTRDPVELLALARKLRGLKADTLIYLGGGRSQRSVYRDLVFFRGCGFSRIIGAPIPEDLRMGLVDPASGFVEREAERLTRCLAPLGPIDIEARSSWDLRLTADERERAADLLRPFRERPFIAINTGGKSVAKDWGDEKWRELLSRLSPLLPLAAVLVGSAEDKPRAERLSQLWSQPVLNCCGLLGVRETAALLAEAKCFVGHDSGPLHLAAAAGVPVIGIFGPLNKPRKWYPVGSHHRIVHQTQSVALIRAAEIERAVLDVCDIVMS